MQPPTLQLWDKQHKKKGIPRRLEFEFSLVIARGEQIFQKYKSHLKIPCIRRVT
jgi:hypothetical protein